MRRPIAFLSLFLCVAAAPTTRPAPRDPIHTLIFSRPDPAGVTYPNMVDPPLWADSHYLLEGESHRAFLSALDDLLAQPMVRVDPGPDPRWRALVQHALWQVFDWTNRHDGTFVTERIALRKKLAATIRHVALTKAEIDALPANLVSLNTPDAPPNVLDAKSGWLSVGVPGSTPIAEAHVRAFGARSVFGVFIHHADGPEAGVAFLQRLAAAPYPPTPGSKTGGFYQRDSVPQFPAGTKLALVRRMMLIDRDGQLVASPITQSVQLRTFLRIEDQSLPTNVRVDEFVLDRDRYLAGKTSAWHAMSDTDSEPATFQTHDIDPFESPTREPGREAYRPPRPVLASCIACHRDAGAASMLSHTRLFSGQLAGGPKLESLSMDREIEITQFRKQQDATWGLLRGYWEAALP